MSFAGKVERTYRKTERTYKKMESFSEKWLFYENLSELLKFIVKNFLALTKLFIGVDCSSPKATHCQPWLARDSVTFLFVVNLVARSSIAKSNFHLSWQTRFVKNY